MRLRIILLASFRAHRLALDFLLPLLTLGPFPFGSMPGMEKFVGVPTWAKIVLQPDRPPTVRPTLLEGSSPSIPDPSARVSGL